MLKRLLSDIKLGEVVIFGKAGYNLAFDRIRTLNDHGFSLRFVSTDNECMDNIAVVRRPLLLNPERKAYVCMHIYHDDEIDFEPLFNRLYNCVDQNPEEIDIVEQQNRKSYVGALYKLASKTTYFDDSDLRPCIFHENSEVKHVDVDESDIDYSLQFDQKQWLDRLSALVLEYVAAKKSLPPEDLINSVISGKLQINSDNELSPIVVNGDMRIILSAYNELEIRMTPLARTVYILFLCHPKGIVLKNIGDYRKQLRDIYLMVKPGADSALADEYINELCYLGSDSLQQKLSLIKRSINRYILPEKLAKPYHITGARGKEYNINIPAEKITLPRVLEAYKESSCSIISI